MKQHTKTPRASWPPPFIVPPKAAHTHTFILLHGLGSNGEKFGSELLASGTSSEGKTLSDVYPGAKFIFPTAKWRRSTAFNRAVITAWFDFYSLDDRTVREDIQIDGLTESAGYIRSIISQEMEGLSAKNIILGGLSQGCATSLVVLLSLEYQIGAFVGMSGRLPFCNDIDQIIHSSRTEDENVIFGEEDVVEEVSPSIQELSFVRDLLSLDAVEANSLLTNNALLTPMFLGHGAKDEKVPCILGEDAVSTLSSLGFNVTWKRYPGLAHWYQVPEEIDDILQFLSEKK